MGLSPLCDQPVTQLLPRLAGSQARYRVMGPRPGEPVALGASRRSDSAREPLRPGLPGRDFGPWADPEDGQCSAGFCDSEGGTQKRSAAREGDCGVGGARA